MYAPFRDARRLPDGSKLSIYLDTASNRSGTARQDTMALAIDCSRFIVLVYSEVYFREPYCCFEIKRAHRKWIAVGEESRCVLPVMRGHPEIHHTVDDIQAVSIDDVPDLVQQYVAEIADRLSRPNRATTQSASNALDRARH